MNAVSSSLRIALFYQTVWSAYTHLGNILIRPQLVAFWPWNGSPGTFLLTSSFPPYTNHPDRAYMKSQPPRYAKSHRGHQSKPPNIPSQHLVSFSPLCEQNPHSSFRNRSPSRLCEFSMSTKQGDPIGRIGALGGRISCMLLLSAFLDFTAAASLSFGLGQLDFGRLRLHALVQRPAMDIK